MPREILTYDIFVASPSDVQTEREVVEKVVRELNATWTKHLKLQLNVIRWETHTRPDFDVDSQTVINKQLPPTVDVFIGILWARVGTPTPRAPSGTLEEFERAYSQWKNDSNSIHLMMYFKTAPVQMSSIDPKQVSQVQSFQSQLPEAGSLYSTFATAEEFATLLSRHLAALMQELAKAATPSETSDTPAAAQKEPEPETGLLDLIEEWTDSLGVASAILNTFTNHIEDVTTATNFATDRLKRLDHSKAEASKSAKSTIDDVAGKLDALAIVMDAELPAFGRSFGQALIALDGVIKVSADFGEQGKDQIRQLEPQLVFLAGNMKGSIGNMKGFRFELNAAPRMTTKLNRANRRAVSAMDRLIGLLEGLSDRKSVV